MLEARDHRPQPGLDDKALASWNGMALAALAEGARVLERPDLLEAAEQCAGFLLGPLSRPDGTLWRTHRDGRSSIPGFLDDHAQVAEGLWQLHRATLDPRWLSEARRLALLADDRRARGWLLTARSVLILVTVLPVVVFGGGLDGLVDATYVAASLALLLLVWLLFAYASRPWVVPEPLDGSGGFTGTPVKPEVPG
jgi:hypothetical protein